MAGVKNCFHVIKTKTSLTLSTKMNHSCQLRSTFTQMQTQVDLSIVEIRELEMKK